MHKTWTLGVALMMTLHGLAVNLRPETNKPHTNQAQTNGGVRVEADEAHRRVDVSIDGRPFTSYIWPASLKKPVLYPLLDGDGVPVTRGYPLEPHEDERVDHPHHAGLWFNYGNVNGFDFWNNSDAIKPEAQSKMGSIIHSRIVSSKSGADRGELVVEATWVTGEGKAILEQKTVYVFLREKAGRAIDMTVRLTALDRAVFQDDKEGLLGMRVTRWLESPDEKGGTFLDAKGNATQVAAAPVSAEPPTGEYRTSEGVKGAAVWSTRGRWCALTGHEGDHIVTIAIFDHRQNPGYPTYWHARGYGLFAANPLGRSIFATKEKPFNFTLEKGQMAAFRYRIAIQPGATSAAELNREASAFGQ